MIMMNGRPGWHSVDSSILVSLFLSATRGEHKGSHNDDGELSPMSKIGPDLEGPTLWRSKGADSRATHLMLQ